MKFERFETLKEAGIAAGKITSGWTFQKEPERYNLENLLVQAELHDAEGVIDLDGETFYLVAPNGAIGYTEDNGEAIDWLFFPYGQEQSNPAEGKAGEGCVLEMDR